MMHRTVANPDWWWSGVTAFVRRQAVLPFETAFALVSIWAGVAGLFGWSLSSLVFNASLSSDLVTLFNLMSLVAGVAIFCGLGWNYPNLEAFGLILLFTSLAVRAVTTASLTGVTDPLTISIIVNALCVGPACLIRFHSLWKGEVIVSTNGVVTTPEELAQHGSQ